jgi:hypothetical protein
MLDLFTPPVHSSCLQDEGPASHADAGDTSESTNTHARGPVTPANMATINTPIKKHGNLKIADAPPVMNLVILAI